MGRLCGAVRQRAPQHQQLADVLNRGCTELVGQLVEHGASCFAVVREHAHLDQAVGLQGSVAFFDDGRCQAIIADHDDRVEMVGLAALVLAVGGRELNRRHSRIIPSFMKTQTKSKKLNKAWLHDHVTDTYVRLAQKEGYRARAAYKLKEIDETFHLFRPGQVVVDLGSAPGAWSQYLRRRFAPKTAGVGGAATGELDGTIIALDLLEMEPIDGVQFIQGDFCEEAVLGQLEALLAGRPVDVVVSDMAPNLSGVAVTDGARVANLIELAIDFSQNHLKPQGALVAKVFHGSGYTQLVDLFKAHFKVVKPLKPKSSRDKSAETFLIGIGLKKA